jgi:hypothetical protein
MNTEVSFLRVKKLEGEVDHSSSSTEVKSGDIPPIPLRAFMEWTETTLPFYII